MGRAPFIRLGSRTAATILIGSTFFVAASSAQETPAINSAPPEFYSGRTNAARLLGVPVTTLFPGKAPSPSGVDNPVAGKADAVQRGMSYFTTFNCVGCHAPNAGGGMGPALSNKFFLYGGEPANIYLSIHQGRPNGMPAWGATLPDNIIWDLVAYIDSISNEPEKTWGQTFSVETMKIEQVPAEFLQSATPWSSTEPFTFGQKPKH